MCAHKVKQILIFKNIRLVQIAEIRSTIFWGGGCPSRVFTLAADLHLKGCMDADVPL